MAGRHSFGSSSVGAESRRVRSYTRSASNALLRDRAPSGDLGTVKLPTKAGILDLPALRSSNSTVDAEILDLSVSRYGKDPEGLRNLLQEGPTLEFNKWRSFSDLGNGRPVTHRLVDKSAPLFKRFVNLVALKGQEAANIAHLALFIVPAVKESTPGRVRIEFCDDRMEDGFEVIKRFDQPVRKPMAYLLHTTYSVPIKEMDFYLRWTFEDVPVKRGRSIVWCKAMWTLDVTNNPVVYEAQRSAQVLIPKRALSDACEAERKLLCEAITACDSGQPRELTLDKGEEEVVIDDEDLMDDYVNPMDVILPPPPPPPDIPDKLRSANVTSNYHLGEIRKEETQSSKPDSSSINDQ